MSDERCHDYNCDHMQNVTEDSIKVVRQALYDAKFLLATMEPKLALEKINQALDETQKWT